MFSPPAFPLPTGCKFSFYNLTSPICASHTPIVSFNKTINLAKEDKILTSPSPEAINWKLLPSQGCGLVNPSWSHTRMQIGLNLCESYVGLYGCFDSLNVAVLSCIEDIISLWPSWPLTPNVSTSFLRWSPSLGKQMWYSSLWLIPPKLHLFFTLWPM